MASEMVYQWKRGARLSIDAQVAGERLETIRERNSGVLTPAAVVSDARDELSPLHTTFEWDDSRAADKYRETQAAYLIRSVVVVMRETEEKPPAEVRAFVSVIQHDEAEERSYTHVEVAMRDPHLRAQVISRAYSELQSWRKRYADLEEFASVYSLIDEMDIAAE
jgi:hypothetical protein